MKQKRILLYAVCAVGVAVLLLLSFSIIEIGIPECWIVKREREKRGAPDSWAVMSAEEDGIFAVCFYDKAGASCRFAVYTKHTNGIGYFFYTGGSVVSIDGTPGRTQIQRVRCRGTERLVLISMNTEGVARIAVQCGEVIEYIEVDAQYPFLYIAPVECKAISLLDSAGHVLEAFP